MIYKSIVCARDTSVYLDRPMHTKINCLLTKGFFLRFDHYFIRTQRRRKTREISKRVFFTFFSLSLGWHPRNLLYFMKKKALFLLYDTHSNVLFCVFFFNVEINYIQLNALAWQLCFVYSRYHSKWWCCCCSSFKIKRFSACFVFTNEMFMSFVPFWFCFIVALNFRFKVNDQKNSYNNYSEMMQKTKNFELFQPDSWPALMNLPKKPQ